MIAYIIVLTGRLGFGGGEWIECFAANSRVTVLRADHVAVANASDPRPIHAIDQAKPCTAEPGISNQDRRTTCRQHGGKFDEKCLMHMR